MGSSSGISFLFTVASPCLSLFIVIIIVIYAIVIFIIVVECLVDGPEDLTDLVTLVLGVLA